MWDRKKITDQFERIITEGMAAMFVRTTASGIVYPGPCVLHDVVISSDGGGQGTGIVYDGEDTSGDYKLDLIVLQNFVAQYRFKPPIYFRKGLYVVDTANIKSVTFNFTPIRA